MSVLPTSPVLSPREAKEYCTSRVKIECAGLTNIGQKRETNQDHFLIADLHKNIHVAQSSMALEPELFGPNMGKLLFVAVGMGGSQAGEVASQMAIQAMAKHFLDSMHWLYCPTECEIEQFMTDLKNGAWRSHKAVRCDGITDPKHRGMGTTLTVAYLFWPMLYVLHVGDSRCYVLRGDSIQRLTEDQTLAQLLYSKGQLSDAEFRSSRYHHILVSSIGCDVGPNALVYKTQLLADDRILICSDGVNAHLNDEEIETVLRDGHNPDCVCHDLIDTVNGRGGHDNITAVVAFCNRD